MNWKEGERPPSETAEGDKDTDQAPAAPAPAEGEDASKTSEDGSDWVKVDKAEADDVEANTTPEAAEDAPSLKRKADEAAKETEEKKRKSTSVSTRNVTPPRQQLTPANAHGLAAQARGYRACAREEAPSNVWVVLGQAEPLCVDGRHVCVRGRGREEGQCAGQEACELWGRRLCQLGLWKLLIRILAVRQEGRRRGQGRELVVRRHPQGQGRRRGRGRGEEAAAGSAGRWVSGRSHADIQCLRERRRRRPCTRRAPSCS